MTTIKNVVVAVLLGMMFSISACNTMHGVGEDVEKGGEKIQGAAEDAKN